MSRLRGFVHAARAGRAACVVWRAGACSMVSLGCPRRGDAGKVLRLRSSTDAQTSNAQNAQGCPYTLCTMPRGRQAACVACWHPGMRDAACSVRYVAGRRRRRGAPMLGFRTRYIPAQKFMRKAARRHAPGGTQARSRNHVAAYTCARNLDSMRGAGTESMRRRVVGDGSESVSRRHETHPASTPGPRPGPLPTRWHTEVQTP